MNRAKVTNAIVCLVILLFVGGTVGWRLWTNRTRHFTWDLSKSHYVSKIDLPPNQRGELLSYGVKENISLSLLLPGGRRYKCDHVANIFIKRSGTQITSLKIGERPVTMDQAIQRLADYGQLWGFELNGVPSWKRNALRGSYSGFASDVPLPGRHPEIQFHIIPAIGTPERPWYVQLTIWWDPGRKEKEQKE